MAGVSCEGIGTQRHAGTGLGGKEHDEDWGWDFCLSFIWLLEAQMWGNAKRMDFYGGLFFLKHVQFSREEKGAVCSLPACGICGQLLALPCWVSPPTETPELAAVAPAVSGGHRQG